MKGIEKNKKLTFASLFSGIGGADIAATAAGLGHKFWCEWDPFCQTVLKYWFNNSIGYNDITKTDFTGWRGKIDILHASPPCQSVSVAGKRKGEADDRFLWGDAIRALDEIRPTWFTFENVAGIESMVESVPYIRMARKGGDHGENCESCIGQSYQRGVLYGILEKIRLQGYEVQVFNIPACAVGAPHERKRIWIVGHLTDTNSERRKHGRDNREERPVRDEQPWYTPENIRDWGQWVSEFGENGKDGSATDTVYNRLENTSDGRTGGKVCEKTPQGILSEPVEAEGVARTATDAACKQGERNGSKQRENRTAKQMQHRGRGGKDGGFWRSEDFWRDFPTEPPVCRGDDGFPLEVDSLAIPFRKWRTEAVKAYGNALVPQVLYQFYNVINKIEQIKNK